MSLVELGHLLYIRIEPIPYPLAILLRDSMLIPPMGISIDNALRGHHPRHQGLEHSVRSPWVNDGGGVAGNEVTLPRRLVMDAPRDIGAACLSSTCQWP